MLRLGGSLALPTYSGLLSCYAWEVSVNDWSKATDEEWRGEPIDQATYVPVEDARYRDLLAFREAFRRFLVGRFHNLDYMSRLIDTPVRSWDDVPLSATVPRDYRLAAVWIDFVPRCRVGGA